MLCLLQVLQALLLPVPLAAVCLPTLTGWRRLLKVLKWVGRTREASSSPLSHMSGALRLSHMLELV